MKIKFFYNIDIDLLESDIQKFIKRKNVKFCDIKFFVKSNIIHACIMYESDK